MKHVKTPDRYLFSLFLDGYFAMRNYREFVPDAACFLIKTLNKYKRSKAIRCFNVTAGFQIRLSLRKTGHQSTWSLEIVILIKNAGRSIH